MTELPKNTVTQEDLTKWYELKEQLAIVKVSEMLLRQKIFAGYFPSPIEGTNTAKLNAADIDDKWVIKGTYPITREIDVGALEALSTKDQKSQLSVLEAEGIAVDKLVQYKPSLVLKEYRTLTKEQQDLFDQCLIVKPGSPALEIVLPKKAAKAGEKA